MPITVSMKKTLKFPKVFLYSILLLVVGFYSNLSMAQDLDLTAKLNLIDEKIKSEENTKNKINLYIDKSDLVLSQDYGLAEKILLKAKLLTNDVDFAHGLLQVDTRLANIYTYFYGNFYKGMKFSSMALLLAKDLKNKELELNMYKNISNIFFALKDYKKSNNYATKAYNIAKELNLPSEFSNINSILGRINETQGKNDSALYYYGEIEKVWVLNEKINSEDVLFVGKYYMLLGEFEKSEKTYLNAIQTFLNDKNYKLLSHAYAELAKLYLSVDKNDMAADAALKGIVIADSSKFLKEKAENFKSLSEVYQQKEKDAEALVYLKKYYDIRDSLYSEKISNQIFLFEDEFKKILHQNEVKSLKDIEETQDLKLKNEALKRNVLIVSLLLLVFSAFTLYSRLRITTKLNNRLVEQKDQLKQLSIVASDINNSVVIINPNMEIDWINQGYNNLTGFSMEDVKGKKLLYFSKGPLWDEERADYISQLFLSNKPFNFEFLNYKKNGDHYWVDTNVTPSFNSEGELEKFIAVGTDITEKKRAEIDLKHSYESARLLSEIGVGITAAITVEEIVDLVYAKLSGLMDATCFGVGLVNYENDSLNFVNFIEENRKFKNVSCSLTDKNKIGVIAMLNNKEYFINNLEKEYHNYLEERPDVVAGQLPQSLIYIPLRSKGKSIGVFTVQSFEKNAYQESHFDLAKNVANYVAIAIEKAILYEEMEGEVAVRTKEIIKQKDELLQTYSNTKLLSKIGLDISSTLDFNEIFETVHSKVSKLMDAEIFGVRIYHEDTQEIEYNYEIESGELDPLGFMSMEDKNNYTVWCIENRDDVFIKDNDIEYLKYISEVKVLSGKSPRSLIFTPMIIEGKVIGVLTVQSMRVNAFEHHHLDLLKSLGAYVGSALLNGSLYSTLEAKVEARTRDLAEKNKNITASINYAKRIQNGILPSENLIKSLLPKSFVYFKPKDIVSGDFYWIAQKNGKIFVAVVDCTGHGVPGAFMSIIGEGLLEQAINEPYITHTNQILDYIQEGLQKLFEQEFAGDNYDDIFDGMDMSLCAINIHKKRIEYSGACNSLFKVREGVIERLRGDKFGISAVDYGIKRNFTSMYVDFEAGDSFYLFSDGVPDQFGGPRQKKFGYKNTQALLSEISELEASSQVDYVNERLSEWSENIEQTDDICMIGFKI